MDRGERKREDGMMRDRGGGEEKEEEKKKKRERETEKEKKYDPTKSVRPAAVITDQKRHQYDDAVALQRQPSPQPPCRFRVSTSYMWSFFLNLFFLFLFISRLTLSHLPKIGADVGLGGMGWGKRADCFDRAS